MRTQKTKPKVANSREATPTNEQQSPLKGCTQELPFDSRAQLRDDEDSGDGSDPDSVGSTMLTSVRRSQDVFRAKENADSMTRKHNGHDLFKDDNDDLCIDSKRHDALASKLTLHSPKFVPKKNSNEENNKRILPTQWTRRFPQPPISRSTAEQTAERLIAGIALLEKENQELKRGCSVMGTGSFRPPKLHAGDVQGNNTFSSLPFDGPDSAPDNISGIECLNVTETLPSRDEVIDGVEQEREKQDTSTRKYDEALEVITPSNGDNDSTPVASPTKVVEERKTVTPLTIRLNWTNPKASVVRKKAKKAIDDGNEGKITDSDKMDTNTDVPKATVAAESPVAEQSFSSRKKGEPPKENIPTTPKSSKSNDEPQKKVGNEPLDRYDVSEAAVDTLKQDSPVLPNKTKEVDQSYSQDLQKEPVVPSASVVPKKTAKRRLADILNVSNLEDVVMKEPDDLDVSLGLQNALHDSSGVSVKQELVDGQDKKKRRENNGSNNSTAAPRSKVKWELVNDSCGEGQDRQKQSVASKASKRSKVDENGEDFDMTKGAVDWADVKLAGLNDVLNIAEISSGNKLTTIKPKVQQKLFKTDSVYYVDRIMDKTREPVNNKDRVFLVQWLHWNDTSATMCSIEDLRGSKDEFKAFSAYEKAVKVIFDEFCQFPWRPEYSTPQKPKYQMLTETGFCFKWMPDSWWQKQRKAPDFAKQIGLHWYLKILEREWTSTLRSQQPFAGGLRLISFFEFPLSKEFQKFRYIAQSEYTTKAKAFVESASIRDGCTCSCRKVCQVCKGRFTHKFVQLHEDTGRMQATKEQMKAVSFASIRCGPRSSCPADAACRRLPIRRVQLLITYVPRVQGLGVFAVEALRPGDILGEYLGQISLLSEVDPKASRNYQYELHNDLLIEARFAGNETRFVNHSCEPNLRSLMVFRDNTASCPRLYYVAIKDIQPGQELLIDYHPDGKRNHPPPAASDCKCGAKRCRGWL